MWFFLLTLVVCLKIYIYQCDFFFLLTSGGMKIGPPTLREVHINYG